MLVLHLSSICAVVRVEQAAPAEQAVGAETVLQAEQAAAAEQAVPEHPAWSNWRHLSSVSAVKAKVCRALSRTMPAAKMLLLMVNSVSSPT